MVELTLGNKIIQGDCLEVLANFPNNCIDLIYLDPPFFTKKHYAVIWGNHLEIREFSDRWITNNKQKKATKSINVYLDWIEPRLRACHQVLKDTGSMYLHCDWHANAHLRLLMDEIFGEKNFQNEIIWSYRTGGVSKRRWGRKHDTIFFYSKTGNFTFHLIKEKRYYDKPFFNSTDGYQTEKDGRIYVWVHPVDVWDVKAVLNVSKEYLAYPTQKPEELLKRIIEACSNEGDLVLDPMVGGGTTTAAAKRLHRRWIGIDVSPVACQVTANRLGISKWKILNYTPLFEELERLNPATFQSWIVRRLGGIPSPQTTGDMGIDGQFQGNPVQVKRSANVGRNVVDNFETAIRRQGKDKGAIIAFSFTPGAKNEVARAGRKDEIQIELIDEKRMLELGIIREKSDKELELENIRLGKQKALGKTF